MPRERKHKKCESSDSSSSSWSSDESQQDASGCLFQRNPTIVCPPEFPKQYDSSSSESSCPDFARLCEEKPRRCKRKLPHQKSSDSSDESWSSDDSKGESSKSDCSGCDKRCTKCSDCQACKCRECSDYSLSSVLSSLGGTDSSQCADLKGLVKRKKRRGRKEWDPSKESKHSSSSASSHCDKRCNSCASCKACECRQCSDVSLSSVLSALGSESAACAGLKNLVAEPHKPQKAQVQKAQVKKVRPHQKSAKVPAVVLMRSTARAPMRYAKAEKADQIAKEVEQIVKEVQEQAAKEVHDQTTTEVAAVEKPLEVLAEMKKQDSSSGSNRGKKFSITFGPSQGHKWERYIQSNTAININGKLGPTIHLHVGKSYVFSVAGSGDHKFILTDRPDGGSDSLIIPGGFDPVESGDARFQVDQNTPRYFFYHCANHSYEGGQAIVHDA